MPSMVSAIWVLEIETTNEWIEIGNIEFEDIHIEKKYDTIIEFWIEVSNEIIENLNGFDKKRKLRLKNLEIENDEPKNMHEIILNQWAIKENENRIYALEPSKTVKIIRKPCKDIDK